MDAHPECESGCGRMVSAAQQSTRTLHCTISFKLVSFESDSQKEILCLFNDAQES